MVSIKTFLLNETTPLLIVVLLRPWYIYRLMDVILRRWEYSKKTVSKGEVGKCCPYVKRKGGDGAKQQKIARTGERFQAWWPHVSLYISVGKKIEDG